MKREPLYEGKAKVMYATEHPDQLLVYYKDDATAGNGAKKGTILGKGIMNNKISAYFFDLLKKNGIEHHYISMPSEREMLVKKLDIIPLEVVVRNIAAGSLATRFGVPEGTKMVLPIVETYYKNDELNDPMINHFHIKALDIATEEEILEMEETALKINEILSNDLEFKNIELVDIKLEFGKYQGRIILGDEISPDNCRFWDSQTNEKLDKDRFRRDLGNIEEAYKEVLCRLTGEVR